MRLNLAIPDENSDYGEYAERIRRAVSSSEFETALCLWDGLRRALEQRAATGQLTAAEVSAARDLCSWTAINAQCARAHAQRRLAEFQAAAQAANAYTRAG